MYGTVNGLPSVLWRKPLSGGKGCALHTGESEKCTEEEVCMRRQLIDMEIM